MKANFWSIVAICVCVCIFSNLNTKAQNILDMQSWIVGSGTSGAFNANGQAIENTRLWGDGPQGKRAILWEAKPEGQSNDDGGFNHNPFAIDHTKMYRFSIWLKKTNSYDGISYFGTENVNDLNGDQHINPYFWYGDLPELNKWFLVVAYIHGSGDDSTISYGGIYDGLNGTKVVNITDFKFAVGTTNTYIRSYLYYDGNVNDRQYFYAPRVEVVNGDEPTIASLLGLQGITTAQSNFLGNVGIGTATPQSILNIKKNDVGTDFVSIVRNSESSNLDFISAYNGSDDLQTGSFAFGVRPFDDSWQIWNKNSSAPWNNLFAVKANGNVGIGIINPSSKLEISSGIDNDNLSLVKSTIEGAKGAGISFKNLVNNGTLSEIAGVQAKLLDGATGSVKGALSLYTKCNEIKIEAVTITPLGNMGIGITTPDEKLAVNGRIRAHEIKVETANWPDYVFDENYQVGTLEALESYIKTNKHLPEMPSAKEVETNGIALGEMNKLLLKKIEELTLFVIELKKENELIKKEIKLKH